MMVYLNFPETYTMEIVELKKHVAAIHISNKISFLQRKITNVLLQNAYDELLNKESHCIRIVDLAKTIGFDSNNHNFLKSALRGLVTTALEWNILNNGGDEWGIMTTLSEAHIKNGFCYYSYSPTLRNMLYNPEFFTKLNLNIQAQFTSGHAYALYENCVRFKAVGSTGWIDLESFKKLMGVENAASYTEFRELNRVVIKPAIKEVNAVSDIHIEMERETGPSKKVKALKFIITSNPQNFIYLEAQNFHPDKEVYERLLGFGLSDKQANDILIKYSLDYIKGNMDVVEKDVESGKAKKVTPYLLSALEKDYRPRPTKFDKPLVKKVVLARDNGEIKKDMDRLQRAEDALNSMDGNEKNTLLKGFEKDVIASNLTYASLYAKHGPLKSKIVKAAYMDYVATQLGF
jgi:hypothetical protein